MVHGSTVLYPTAEDLHAHRGEFSYGRHGTPTTKALQDVLMALEGPQCAGVGARAVGLAAITTTLLAVLKAGDHLLVCDNVYRPTRNFCNGMLARYGVETSYFDPLIGAGIESLFKPNTTAVLVEAPGSQSFEMPDIPAIAAVAHARGALVIDDNTWATPLYHRSLDQGVDISMQAATKYIGGHSDIMFGTISANAKAWPLVAEAHPPARRLRRSRRRVPGAARHCARWRCGSRSITLGPRDGALARHPPRSRCGCCIRRSKAIPATRSGSATSPARPACSASC